MKEGGAIMPMKIEPMPSEAMIQEEIRYCLLKAIIEAVEKLRRECGKPMPSEGAALVTALVSRIYTVVTNSKGEG
jgi:hypothetical protein